MASARQSLWESGHDETVEVNQRALIDKVLARYSGEFTVFRELLQNSDDAASKAVEIHFDTQAYLDGKKKSADDGTSRPPPMDGVASREMLPDLKTEHVHQWTFKNNGIAFRDEDWNRLKKIAEGNPDEEKIGAFGVGFYSLFSITEEPFVTSGDQWMGFYWKDKKDQLFARRGTLNNAPSADNEWTSFEMPLREPAAIPDAFDFTRFLASSITFMVHLRSVSVFFNDKRLARLEKDPGVPRGLGIPKGLRTKSPMATMQVASIKHTPLQIKAEVMRWVYTSGTPKQQTVRRAVTRALNPTSTQSGFFHSLFSSFAAPQHAAPASPPPVVEETTDQLAINETSVVLAIYSAEVDVKLDRKTAQELLRSTKKNPPSTLRLDLIYTGKMEYDASKQEDDKYKNTGSIFQGLRADLDGTGSTRVFIGHATGQTTGLGGHISARFIPTVERESIDLVDRNVSMWNKELLYVGGFLARAAYELELVTVRDLWKGASESASPSNTETALPDEQMQVWLRDRAIHALRFFTFHPSTPSATVSSLLEAGFFMAGNSGPFPIISSVGVRDAADVRIPDPAFSGFLKQLPVLPDAVVSGAQLMVDTLRARNVIKDISFTDVLAELRARPLSEVELVECLRWWIGVTKQPQQTQASIQHIRQELVSAALLAIAPGTPNEKIIPLSTIKTFVNLRSTGAIMPLDGPFPDHTVLPSVSRPFVAADLISAFSWQELTVVEWIRHVATVPPAKSTPEFDLSVSAAWAERILNCLARAWPSVANAQQLEIVEILKSKSCVPTRSGMKLPAQAYFANANIFPDLPVVTMPNGSAVKGPLEKVLLALGVRKHVDLQVVFDRMIKTGDWTIADLTKYLVAVQQTLTSVEMERLRQTAAFPKEVPANPANPATANDAKPMTRYKASDLYEPLDVFRELKLPVIDWGEHTKWRPSSDEAKFLYGLGLRRFLPLAEILGLAASTDESLRSAALRYFLKNTSRYPDYEPMKFSNLPFIPALKANGTSVMGTPKDVFINPESAILGFNIVHPTLREAEIDQLKLRKNPPTSLIIPLLEKTPPKTQAMAQQWFANLAGRLSEFSAAELTKLSQLPIVPAQPLASSEKAQTPQMRMMAPKDCYFRVDSNQNFHSKLFVFVDFGAKANTFLSACGTKHEPSVEEIVQMMLTDPRRFYHVADGRENYLMELRNIAVNRRLISPALRSRMMKATILLGSRRVRKGKTNGIIPALLGSQDVDEEEWDFEYDLLRPDQVVIADDTNGYQFFGDSVFSAPQEDLLEDFYLDLGSPRLSSLIREDYKTSGEIKDAKISREMRALVLERLPLFLHEHTHARTKVQYSWLNNERNFVVKTFGKLTVTKHLNFGTTRLSRNQDASAAAKSPGYGPIELWLAGNAQVDMYEVAISLCRVLFNTPKVNDALLFMTILSTDLRALRRRGYNVDRILKQQKAERHAAEEARRKEAKDVEKLLSDYLPPGGMPPPVPVASKPMPPLPADAKSGEETPRPTSPDVPSESDTLIPESEKKGISRHPSHFVNSLQSWRKKLGSKGDATSGEGSSTRPGSVVMNGNTRKPQQGVTPLSNIASNIDQAIAACRPERSNLLHNREQMQMVKESMEEGYCDVAGRIGDLDYIGSMADVKVYVSKDVVDGRNIMPTHRDAIARFIHIIQPLRGLYKLPPTSLHIFYDLQGDAIAFNRSASIFLNLRYYESWHDSNVLKGDLNQALISWFFTLAHEIAHNLVQPHNSEHEFWFSSICEAHVIGLGHLIAKVDKTAPKSDGVSSVQQP